ncbi:MAG: hypothetical protein ABI398_13535, partial [Devosia sp.]
DEGRALKAQAIKLVRDQLGTSGLDALKGVLKLTVPGVETYISGAIERALTEQKAAGVVVTGPVLPSPR